MAKDVIINGVEYDDVPAVQLPKVGGGTALFKDTVFITKTVTANGTYKASDDNADGYSQVTVAIPTYDGTVV